MSQGQTVIQHPQVPTQEAREVIDLSNPRRVCRSSVPHFQEIYIATPILHTKKLSRVLPAHRAVATGRHYVDLVASSSRTFPFQQSCHAEPAGPMD